MKVYDNAGQITDPAKLQEERDLYNEHKGQGKSK